MHESSNYDGKRRACQFNRRVLMLSLNAVTGQWKNKYKLSSWKRVSSELCDVNDIFHLYRDGKFVTQRSRATQKCY
jgi:hypothetical protein